LIVDPGEGGAGRGGEGELLRGRFGGIEGDGRGAGAEEAEEGGEPRGAVGAREGDALAGGESGQGRGESGGERVEIGAGVDAVGRRFDERGGLRVGGDGGGPGREAAREDRSPRK
jgi:hypothetical protein